MIWDANFECFIFSDEVPERTDTGTPIRKIPIIYYCVVYGIGWGAEICAPRSLGLSKELSLIAKKFGGRFYSKALQEESVQRWLEENTRRAVLTRNT